MDNETSKLAKDAAQARQEYQLAAGTHAQAVLRRMKYEHEKPIQKDEAIQRIMQGIEGPKGATYTAAERVVESEQLYARFLAEYRESVRMEALAFAAREAEVMKHNEIVALILAGSRELMRLPEFAA